MSPRSMESANTKKLRAYLLASLYMPDVKAWFSRQGWFTLVRDGDDLKGIEVPKKDVKLIRALGGVLYEREGFTDEMIRHFAGQKKKFTQYRSHRLFVGPTDCECQKTGWKSYE